MFLRILVNIKNVNYISYFFFLINIRKFIFYFYNGFIFDFLYLNKFSFSRFRCSVFIFIIYIYNFNYVNIKFKKKLKKILILHENENILAVSKDSDVTIREFHFFVLEYLSFCFFFIDYRFVNFINRIDKETSGLILFSKNFFSFRKFCEVFKKRSIKKSYLGFCYKQSIEELITIKNFHNRKSSEFNFFVSKNFLLNSKYCFSVFKFFNFSINFSEVFIKIFTGRSHQIRVQLKSIKSCLLFDKKYGFFLDNFNFNLKLKIELFLFNKLYLHSYSLFFFDMFLNRFINIISPLPYEFLRIKRIWDIRIRT